MVSQETLPPLVDISIFERAISKDNTSILVPTERLAKNICVAWGEEILPHQNAWKAPPVYSMQQWLRNCWNQLQDLHLSNVRNWAQAERPQRLHYWEQAINHANPELGHRFARLADDTFLNLDSWCLDVEEIESDGLSSRQFKRWTRTYSMLLTKNGFLPQKKCWELIISAFEDEILTPLKCIYLYGFQTIPPYQIKILEQAAHNIVPLDPFCLSLSGDLERPFLPTSPSSGDDEQFNYSFPRAKKISCSNSEHEIRLAAIWAANSLKSNHVQRIGIVVPDLNKRLDEVQRAIDCAFVEADISIPVNFSTGVPISSVPLISAALELLSLFDRKQSLAYWLRILYSPHSRLDALPLNLRADAETQMRRFAGYELSLNQFINTLLRCSNVENQQMVMETIEPFLRIKNEKRNFDTLNKHFSDWCTYFQSTLAAQNWPYARPLNSLEYQQLSQWNALLEDFCSLDNLGINVNVSRALEILNLMANDHVFHEQTPDAPLQVIGMLEASGLQFDTLWVVGLDSMTFPPPVSLNPLLPASYQKFHCLPHSVPERELQIAYSLLRGYHENSKTLILTYPEKREEEMLLQSSLLRRVTNLKCEEFLCAENITALKFRPKLTDECELYKQPSIPLETSREAVRGGASILRNQYICPYNAFMIHRLKANPVEQPHQGISKKQRGILLHEIMFRLWGEWQTSKTLNSLNDSDCYEEINNQIDLTFNHHCKAMAALHGARYRGLEKELLAKLIMRWIVIEKSREPFEVIGREQLLTIVLEKLELKLFIDRVDRIRDKILLIDYKTGDIGGTAWNPAQLAEPQLPLYTLAFDPRPNGIAYAQIKGGNVRLLGESDGVVKNHLKESGDWVKQISSWQLALEALASSFSAGHCDMDINDRAGFNNQTYLLPLNRHSDEFERGKNR